MEKRPFRITKTLADITADTLFGTNWRDTWAYECPENMLVVLEKGNLFFAKLYDSADAEYVAPDARVQIEAREPGGQTVIRVFGLGNYIKSKEAQDRKLMAKLDLDYPVLIKPRDKIVIMSLDSLGMDAASIANSHFELLTSRLIGSLPPGSGLPTKLSGLIEPYDLCQEDSNVTQSDSLADTWSDLFVYRAPKGRMLLLRPGDPFSGKMYDTGTTECSDTDRFKLVKRDQTGQDEVTLTSEILYATLKEFQDEDKLFRLPISRETSINEREYLALMAYSGGLGADKDLSYFDLVCRSKRL